MAATFTKEEFFHNFDIERMNNKSLTIVEKRTYEHMFISRNAFNAIMANNAERVQVEEIMMPNGRMTKWLAVVTTIIFSWLTSAVSTSGSASSAFLTRASQCGHIMPSILSLSFITGSSFLISLFFIGIIISSFGRSFTKFRRRAFVTTQKLERLIAAAPNIGLSCKPKNGINTPAASGMPIIL